MRDDQSATISKKGGRLIDAYLRRVVRAMGDAPAAEKREVVASLREHIQDELAGTAVGGAIGDEEVKLALSAMDPPDSFRPEATSGEGGAAGREGVAGLLILGSTVLVFVILLIIAGLTEAQWLATVSVVQLLVGATVALVLGIISYKTVFGKVTIGVSLAIYLAVSFVTPITSVGTSPEPEVEYVE